MKKGNSQDKNMSQKEGPDNINVPVWKTGQMAKFKGCEEGD